MICVIQKRAFENFGEVYLNNCPTGKRILKKGHLSKTVATSGRGG